MELRCVLINLSVWEYRDPAVEVRQGKKLVDAAISAQVEHFVWSSIDHEKKPFVSHWNSKADVNDYLIEKGLPRTT